MSAPFAPDHPPVRHVDGFICFGGEDWWYHNRGHFDMQMMRSLSARVPVIYVNSIGMRTPRAREGRVFLKRIARKLRSLSRGRQRIDDRFAVLSGITAPGERGRRLTRPLLIRQIRRAARAMNMSHPLVWVACPTAEPLLEDLDATAIVYQRTDRYECFPGVDTSIIRRHDRALKARADLTVFCASVLHEAEREDCNASCLIDHGLVTQRFEDAVRADDAPDDVLAIPGPRIGFVGGIDAHTFDPDLLNACAARLPEASFVLVGSCSLPADWCPHDNVHQLGQRPYEDVARYMAACNVLIMPWRRNEWIAGCNPVKLKEYLATGRPIVSTPFSELQHYDGLVRVAGSPDAFVDAIRDALARPGDSLPRRARARDHDWSRKGEDAARALAALNVRLSDDHALSAAPTPVPPSIPAASPVASRPLGAHILLAGGLAPTPLVRACGLSVLDLHLTGSQTVLDLWLERFAELEPNEEKMRVRVITSAGVPAPVLRDTQRGRVRLEPDRAVFRGPAGAVRDTCEGLADDETVVIAEAARCAACDLRPMLDAHRRRGAAVTVAANPDGSPAGIYLASAAAVRHIPEAGFSDLKEQWLQQVVAAGDSVDVHVLPAPGLLALPTRPAVLRAARRLQGLDETTSRRPWTGGHGEHGTDLRVICAGAAVGPDALVIDSIVMPGAIIGPGAIIVRSLVCCDTAIEAGEEIADAVVSAHCAVRDERSRGRRRESRDAGRRLSAA